MNDSKSENNSSQKGEDHLGPNNFQNGPDYDPVNLMSQVFENVSTFIGPAQDILLSWLLRLPQSIPPAQAAQKTLNEIISGRTEGASREALELIELMTQVAEHNTENLKKAGQDRRRGGRTARVKD